MAGVESFGGEGEVALDPLKLLSARLIHACRANRSGMALPHYLRVGREMADMG